MDGWVPALQVRRANEGGGQQAAEQKPQDAFAHIARVVKLSHAVTPEELADNEAYQDIMEGERASAVCSTPPRAAHWVARAVHAR